MKERKAGLPLAQTAQDGDGVDDGGLGDEDLLEPALQRRVLWRTQQTTWFSLVKFRVLRFRLLLVLSSALHLNASWLARETTKGC